MCNHFLYLIWGNLIISVIDSLEENHFFSSSLQLMIWHKQAIITFTAITMGLFFFFFPFLPTLFYSFSLVCVCCLTDNLMIVLVKHTLWSLRGIILIFWSAIVKQSTPCAQALVRRGEAAWMEHLGGPRVNAAIMPKWVNVGFQRSSASHAGIQCTESNTGGGFSSFLPISLL